MITEKYSSKKDYFMRKTLAFLAAASMAVGSVAQAAPAADRVAAPIGANEQMGGGDGYFPAVPVLLAFGAIIVGLVLIMDDDDDFIDNPFSP